MLKRLKAFILHKWNVYLWEREVKQVAGIIACFENIQRNSLDYKSLVRAVASNQIVSLHSIEVRD